MQLRKESLSSCDQEFFQYRHNVRLPLTSNPNHKKNYDMMQYSPFTYLTDCSKISLVCKRHKVKNCTDGRLTFLIIPLLYKIWYTHNFISGLSFLKQIFIGASIFTLLNIVKVALSIQTNQSITLLNWVCYSLTFMF